MPEPTVGARNSGGLVVFQARNHDSEGHSVTDRVTRSERKACRRVPFAKPDPDALDQAKTVRPWFTSSRRPRKPRRKRLPEVDLKTGEPLVMVDHGYDDGGEILGDPRRFREGRGTKVPRAGGWISFAQAGRHTYRGGRGGPCLRESGNSAVVGILNGTFARQPSFTSTYPYRLWLREELERGGGRRYRSSGRASPVRSARRREERTGMLSGRSVQWGRALRQRVVGAQRRTPV